MADPEADEELDSVPETDESSDAAAGVSLTPEEMDALREATTKMAEGTTYLLVPVDRVRTDWDEVLEQAGLEYEYVSELHSLARAVDEGRCAGVVIDADACPAGGLAALARLRRRVPVVVVASAPTRTHVVSCLAAGACGYHLKPITAESLTEIVTTFAG